MLHVLLFWGKHTPSLLCLQHYFLSLNLSTGHPTQNLAAICAVPEQFVENLQHASACANTEMKDL